MDNIWVTSDLHLMHSKSFLWQPRGFSSTEEMCEAIVERWNSVVDKGDMVYNLGDIALSDTDAAIPYLQRLNGYQVWLKGNHDSDNRVNKVLETCPNIHLLDGLNSSYATIIKSGKWRFYLSHYPTHGHTHQQTNFLQPNNPFLYHVGLDSHNCYPVNLEEIKTEIKDAFYQLKSDF